MGKTITTSALLVALRSPSMSRGSFPDLGARNFDAWAKEDSVRSPCDVNVTAFSNSSTTLE